MEKTASWWHWSCSSIIPAGNKIMHPMIADLGRPYVEEFWLEVLELTIILSKGGERNSRRRI